MYVDISVPKRNDPADFKAMFQMAQQMTPSLQYAAPDYLRKKFRNGLTVAFAGNPDGKMQCFANDCLGVRQLQTTVVCQIH